MENDQKYMHLYKKLLEIDGGVILDRSGRSDLYGNLDVCSFWAMLDHCVFISGKTELQQNMFVKIVSRPSPSYKSFKLTLGSFHGFSKQSTLSLHLLLKYWFFCMSLFSVLNCKQLSSF